MEVWSGTSPGPEIGVAMSETLIDSNWLEMARKVVLTHQFAVAPVRIVDHEDPREDVVLDATTANMLVTVHDALKGANQAKFASMPLLKAVNVGWALVTKSNEKASK